LGAWEGGPKAADECCDAVERLHGRRKLDDVLLEFDLILQAETEAWAFRAARTRAN
jgi:hypothetical protein